MDYKIIDNWDSYFNLFYPTQKDIYYTEEYMKLYESETDRGVCFVCQDGDKVLLFPFLVREFEFQGKTYKDFETAYGYGGPLYNTEDEVFITTALKSLKEYCAKNGYVAGFVRFHPMLANIKGFNQVGLLIADRQTIAMDLSMSEDEMWMNEVHTKNRNVIKKAVKEGLTFEADYEYKYLKEFVNLYNSTMCKLSADLFYYFNDAYYEKLVKSIPNSFLGVVKNGEQILSAAIFMYSEPYGHYHLSGSDKTQLCLSPNNYMLWEAAKELKKHNVMRFHLGGGTTSGNEDSLFQFKKKFSKFTLQFYIGKLIFNEDTYNDICAEWIKNNPEKAEIYKHHLLKYKY